MSRSWRWRRPAASAACAAAALLGLYVDGAGAAYDPAGSGATRLELEKGFATMLKENGVKLGVVGGATLKGREIAFPVSGGKVDAAAGRGTVLHGGSVRIGRGSRGFRIDDLMVKTTRPRSPLAAKVGGGQIKLFTARDLSVRRTGFGVSIRSVDLLMSANLAVRLNHKLGLHRVFEEGLPVGSAVTRVEPSLASISQRGRLSLDLDPALLAKLNQLFVAVNPIHPAEHPGAFTFPIFGGRLSPQLSAGVMDGEGSLELLQLGGGQIFWREPSVDLGGGSLSVEADVEPAPPYRGEVGPVAVASLDLSAGVAASHPSARTFEVNGARLVLSGEGAGQLNEAFAEGKPVFAAGEAMGTLSFAAEAN